MTDPRLSLDRLNETSELALPENVRKYIMDCLVITKSIPLWEEMVLRLKARYLIPKGRTFTNVADFLKYLTLVTTIDLLNICDFFVIMKVTNADVLRKYIATEIKMPMPS